MNRFPSEIQAIDLEDPFLEDSDVALARHFHLAIRNNSAFKDVRRAYQVHYEPHVRELSRHASRQIGGRTYRLPPTLDFSMPLDQAIIRRQSTREFSSDPLSLDQLSTILFAACGVRAVLLVGDEIFHQRNVPNSGNLGSTDVFVASFNVEGIEPGLYHYDAFEHRLELVESGHFRRWFEVCVVYQPETAAGAAVIMLTSEFGRIQEKYGARGYRLSLIDAGHVSENLYLTATALGLAACATAGFIDERIDEALGLDGMTRSSTLMIALGRPRREEGPTRDPLLTSDSRLRT